MPSVARKIANHQRPSVEVSGLQGFVGPVGVYSEVRLCGPIRPTDLMNFFTTARSKIMFQAFCDSMGKLKPETQRVPRVADGATAAPAPNSGPRREYPTSEETDHCGS